MSMKPIEAIFHDTDRYKLYTLMCNQDKLFEGVLFLMGQKINTVNMGKELAIFINGLEDYSYLNIDVFDFVKKLLEKHITKIGNSRNGVVAVYNLGILLEPTLKLNVVHLLKEFSKATALIIIWENRFDPPNRLYWLSQKNNTFLDFGDAQIKNFDYAI
jgi:hypothetical protein